jgi:hypothetical protein
VKAPAGAGAVSGEEGSPGCRAVPTSTQRSARRQAGAYGVVAILAGDDVGRRRRLAMRKSEAGRTHDDLNDLLSLRYQIHCSFN